MVIYECPYLYNNIIEMALLPLFYPPSNWRNLFEPSGRDPSKIPETTAKRHLYDIIIDYYGALSVHGARLRVSLTKRPPGYTISRNMNAIDEIGQAVGVTRGKEKDDKYALRILQVLYHTFKATHAEGWTGDRETNEYALVTPNGVAYIVRDHMLKIWAYTIVSKGNHADGVSRALDKAMQICSLVLSE